MNAKQYLVYDGVLRPVDVPLFRSTNRGFRYGDAIFETMRYHKGRPLFWDAHYRRLIQGMAVMRFLIKGFPTADELLDSISDLVVKNRLFYDVRIRLTVFRKGEGLYTPESLQASWLIETTPLTETGYALPEKGLLIDVFKDFPKLHSPLSAFKSASSVPYVLAGIFCRENDLDDCLIVNGNDKIIESLSSSLFWIKHQTLYTPLVSTGCIDGVMRKQIIELAPLVGLKLVENQGATQRELMEADEIFLTNAIGGIRWVSGFRGRRYFSKYAGDLYRKLMEQIRANYR